MKNQINKKVIITSVVAGVGAIGAIASTGTTKTNNQNIQNVLRTRTVESGDVTFKVVETNDSTIVDFYFNRKENYTYEAIFYISEFNSLAILGQDYFVNEKSNCISYTFNKSFSKKTYSAKILEINNQTRQSKIITNFDNREIFVVNSSTSISKLNDASKEKLNFAFTQDVIKGMKEHLSNLFTDEKVIITDTIKFVGYTDQQYAVYTEFNEIISKNIEKIQYSQWKQYFQKFDLNLKRVHGDESFVIDLDIELYTNYIFSDSTSLYKAEMEVIRNKIDEPTNPGEPGNGNDQNVDNKDEQAFLSEETLRNLRGNSLLITVASSAALLLIILATTLAVYNSKQQKKALQLQKQKDSQFIRENNKNLSEIGKAFQELKKKNGDK